MKKHCHPDWDRYMHDSPDKAAGVYSGLNPTLAKIAKQHMKTLDGRYVVNSKRLYHGNPLANGPGLQNGYN